MEEKPFSPEESYRAVVEAAAGLYSSIKRQLAGLLRAIQKRKFNLKFQISAGWTGTASRRPRTGA